MADKQSKNSRILVDLDDSNTKPGFVIPVLAEWDYYYGSDDEFGITARCEDGSWQTISERLPSIADYHDIDTSSGISLDKIKTQVCDEVGCDADDLPWFEYGQNFKVLPSSDTLDAAKAWLGQPIDMSQDQYCDFGNRSVTEYVPGFDLWRCASAQEYEQLSIQEVDLGGPASTVPCIIVKNEPDLIAAAFDRHDLGYLIRN